MLDIMFFISLLFMLISIFMLNYYNGDNKTILIGIPIILLLSAAYIGCLMAVNSVYIRLFIAFICSFGTVMFGIELNYSKIRIEEIIYCVSMTICALIAIWI